MLMPSLITFSRIFFLILIVNEVIVTMRTPPEQREMPMKKMLAATGILVLLPLVWPWNLPVWLQVIMVGVQALGLALELGAERQLIVHDTFSLGAVSPNKVQTRGFYGIFENPIYVGLLAQMLAWCLWSPIALIFVAVFYMALRQAVSTERGLILEKGHVVAGIDSFMWRN